MDEETLNLRNIALGKALRLHRLRRKLSQFALGVSQFSGAPVVNRIENARNASSLRTLWRAAEELEQPLWEVFLTAEAFFHGAPDLEHELAERHANRPKGRPTKP